MARPHNISRVDDDARRTHAWLLRVQRGNRAVTKMFSDGMHGGKRKALQAAVDYRDQLLAQVPLPEYQFWRNNRLRKNNSSGIAGVSRHENTDTRQNTRRVFWLASWTDEHGAPHKRRFSIPHHGERQARALAIEERERQLKRVCAIKAEMAGKRHRHAGMGKAKGDG